MSKLKHAHAKRYRKVDGTDEEEEVYIIPEEARRCDTLTDPETGNPLFLRAEKSIDVKPHFAFKEKLNDRDRKIQEEISLKTPDDITHEYAQALIKIAFNKNIDILIYLKKCGKHHEKIPTRFIDLHNKGYIIELEVTISGTRKRWDVLIIDPETGDTILGIEVYNTHRTDETSRPSNVTWVELDANKIINELKYDLADPQFDINTKNFKFYCMRSFINSSEINKCNICVEDEKRIQEEQETRRKEVEKIEKIKEITETNRRNKIIYDNVERERQELEIEENIKRQKQREEDEEKRKSILKEENIKRQTHWEEGEEKRKSILSGTESKLKQATKELEYIQEKIRIHKVAIYNIWLKINDIKRNRVESDELQKLKDHEQDLNNFKIKNKKKEEKLLVDIKQLKTTIEINKFPLIKPSLLYI